MSEPLRVTIYKKDEAFEDSCEYCKHGEYICLSCQPYYICWVNFTRTNPDNCDAYRSRANG